MSRERLPDALEVRSLSHGGQDLTARGVLVPSAGEVLATDGYGAGRDDQRGKPSREEGSHHGGNDVGLLDGQFARLDEGRTRQL
ncbi:hypothetical protein HUV60_005235 [Streptomyces sp. KMM 9044]|nr:hypothetical protein [Streptomyces sp. KMM 9044]WAX77155.1 hypothetical protein HUV60_005235 [Streptomyces sp. KMM 9044]